MVKRYLKYISVITLLLFSFNIRAHATEKITMNINKVKGNSCTYNYDGVELTLYENYDGKVEAKYSGSSKSYDEYSNAAVDSWLDRIHRQNYNPLKNIKTCPKVVIYVYTVPPAVGVVDAKEKTKIWLVPEAETSYLPNYSGWTKESIGTLNGTLKYLTHTCVYSATSPYTSKSYNYTISYNADSGKISGSVENYEYTNISVSKNLKKEVSALKYNNDVGLTCDKNLVVIDFCRKTTSQQGQDTTTNEIYFRTSSEAMKSKDKHYECQASTNPKSGIEVTGKKDDTTATKILPLSDICNNERNVMLVVRFIGYLLLIVKILIPLGLIIIGIINFSRAIITGNEEDLKKSTQSFGIKIVIAIAIFILPTIINFIIGLVDGAIDGTSDYQNCRNCIFNPGKCSIPEK